MSKKSMSLAGIAIAAVAMAIGATKYLSHCRANRLEAAALAEQDVHRFEDEGGTTQSPSATHA